MHIVIDILGWATIASAAAIAVYVATGHVVQITIGDDGSDDGDSYGA